MTAASAGDDSSRERCGDSVHYFEERDGLCGFSLDLGVGKGNFERILVGLRVCLDCVGSSKYIFSFIFLLIFL